MPLILAGLTDKRRRQKKKNTKEKKRNKKTMKRINLCSNMKQHSITTGTKKTEMNGYDFKNPWDTNEGDQVQDFAAWPPRFYTCSFCKREFRSAQALGGHMNVHRRDRARLRQFSPPTFCSSINNNNGNGLLSLLNPNPEPNPTNKNPYPNSNPGFFQSPTSSLSSHFTRFPIPVENFVRPLTGLDSLGMRSKKEGVMGVVQKFDSIFMHGKGCEVVKKEKFVRLDLEIGLSSTHSKEDLDLELRLGRCA